MRMDEFRRDGTKVAGAAELLRHPAVVEMLDVVKREAPHNFGTPSTGWASGDREKWLGVIEGYNMAMNNLEALGVFQEEHRMPEATFGAEETEKEKE